MLPPPHSSTLVGMSIRSSGQTTMCSWHLEPTDWLLMVHGDWDAPAGQYSSWETEVFFWFVLFIFQTLWGEAGISKCVHIQEEKTTFQITTATPVTQQIWNPRDSCLLFNPTTLVLKTKACAEKPQVALSGDFLYDPILLLVCWLAFLFIKKKLFYCFHTKGCSNHLLLGLGICSLSFSVWLFVSLF